ncbi:SPT16-domain-containing protein [Neoconidiobolus thromboides FSU 785]|nr:SPT16-domain-containing protein [Neoconidiobolus thromboides FSU 785]
MGKAKIESEQFQNRLERLINYWKNNKEQFNDVDRMLVITAKEEKGAEEEAYYPKTAQLHTWLFENVLAETLLLFTPEKLTIVASAGKEKNFFGFLNELKSDVAIEYIPFTKEESSTIEAFKKITKLLSETSDVPLGIFQKDKVKGNFIKLWQNLIKEEGISYKEVDVSLGIALALANKDESELKIMRAASRCSSQIMKNIFFEEMATIIDLNKKVTHMALADKIEALLFKEGLKKAKLPTEIVTEKLDWSYTPIIQSGGKYNLKPSAESDNTPIQSGVILCSLGVRYQEYCSNIGRTFLMNASPQQEKNYGFLMDLQKHVLSKLKVGVAFKEVYEDALSYVADKRPDLSGKLFKNCGFITGIEFHENGLVISPKNNHTISEDMVICLYLGLQDLEDDTIESKQLKKYSMLLADTVRIGKGGAVILTDVLKEATDITYFFGNNNGDSKNDEKAKKKINNANVAPPPKTAILKSKFRSEDQEETPEQKRREHQRELFLEKQEDGLRRYKKEDESHKSNKQETFKYFESYKRDTALPNDVNGLNIVVDQRGESIIVPINGLAVPFHISTLKNVSKNEEGEYVYLRLNFLTPGQGVAKKEEMPFEDPTAHFLRSLTFRSTDTFRLTETHKKILELKKEVAKKELQKKDLADVVQQDKLKLVEGRITRLTDIYMRPQPEGKRMPGELEIHMNGLRYKHPRNSQKIDLLFSNTKHIFFQPCENELLVLIHIHLTDPIMIGKRKTKDVQFYREASDVSFDETGNRRRGTMYGDDDELEAEREERRRIKALNEEFKQFANKISDATRGRIEIETPFREIGFTGVPHRSNVLLMPTGDCLVHLSDPPFLVISLSEVEIVHMERVQFGLKNFDMVFVFKDFNKVPARISTIPMKQLDSVKEWLDSVDVVYTEGPVNLNWNAIMKTIKDDPAGFFEDGGWKFLDNEQDGSDAISEESASEFEVDSEELNASSESEYESEAEVASDGSEPSDEEEDSEEGEDWDELERKAINDDKKRPANESTKIVNKKRRN